MKRKVIIAVCVIVALVLCIFGLTRCSNTGKSSVEATVSPEVTDVPETAVTPEPAASAEPSSIPEPAATPDSASEVNEDGSDMVSHILLVGVDNNNSKGLEKLGDADGIVLVSINRTDKTVALTSIVPGTMLDVADHTGVREQATLLYNEYGLDTLSSSVEKTLGLTLDGTLCFNYLNVIDLIDQAGGVDVEATATEISAANSLLNTLNTDLLGCDTDDGLITESAGTVHMTGKQAVCFMRVTLSDETRDGFGRCERVRDAILALKDQFLNLDASAQSDYIKAAFDAITTDLSVADGLSYLNELDKLSSYEFKTGNIPQDDTYYSYDSYIHMNIALNRIWFFGQVYGESGGMPEALQSELSKMQAELDAGRIIQYNY